MAVPQLESKLLVKLFKIIKITVHHFRYLAVSATRIKHDEDPENDEYIIDNIPSANEHECIPTGVDNLVKDFKIRIEEKIRVDPLQPFPALYEETRTEISEKLRFDEKCLFLS